MRVSLRMKTVLNAIVTILFVQNYIRERRTANTGANSNCTEDHVESLFLVAAEPLASMIPPSLWRWLALFLTAFIHFESADAQLPTLPYMDQVLFADSSSDFMFWRAILCLPLFTFLFAFFLSFGMGCNKQFVTREGMHFKLDNGKLFLFSGFNSYYVRPIIPL